LKKKKEGLCLQRPNGGKKGDSPKGRRPLSWFTVNDVRGKKKSSRKNLIWWKRKTFGACTKKKKLWMGRGGDRNEKKSFNRC